MEPLGGAADACQIPTFGGRQTPSGQVSARHDWDGFASCSGCLGRCDSLGDNVRLQDDDTCDLVLHHFRPNGQLKETQVKVSDS